MVLKRGWICLLVSGWFGACTSASPARSGDSAISGGTDGVDDADGVDGADGGTDGTDGGTTAPQPCNGHVELCDRPLDQLTLAGTHNSMSNGDADWVFPNQQHSITRQLNDGVRALMLDTHDYWGEPMLCHTYCELGSQPLDEGLGEVATFLAANPRDIVVIIFQDGLSVDATVAVMDEVGLSRQVWTWDPDAAMPTLGEIIDADTRLIVSAEFSGPPPAWYHHAWDLVADTPYDFGSADDFSCDLNRGQRDNPLLLVNHWLGTPLPTEDGAREVNAADVLAARAQQCAEEWGRPVSILAVDFYNHGDLFAVVDQLNGVAR